eukprot:UN18122
MTIKTYCFSEFFSQYSRPHVLSYKFSIFASLIFCSDKQSNSHFYFLTPFEKITFCWIARRSIFIPIITTVHFLNHLTALFNYFSRTMIWTYIIYCD